MFGSGAQGFLALPYTIIVYPFVLLVMPRLWQVCRPADFVRGWYGSGSLP